MPQHRAQSLGMVSLRQCALVDGIDAEKKQHKSTMILVFSLE